MRDKLSFWPADWLAATSRVEDNDLTLPCDCRPGKPETLWKYVAYCSRLEYRVLCIVGFFFVIPVSDTEANVELKN